MNLIAPVLAAVVAFGIMLAFDHFGRTKWLKSAGGIVILITIFLIVTGGLQLLL